MTAYIIDTECTGLEPDREPIEIALCELPDDWPRRCTRELARFGKFHRRYHQRFKPERPISCGAMAVHHILPRDLADSPPVRNFVLPTDCTFLVGHSVDFDWQAIRSPDVRRICTDAMSRWVWPNADAYSQSALLYMLLGATPETRELLKGAHGAVRDVSSNLILLTEILLARGGFDDWLDVWAYSEECRTPRTMPFTKARGTPLEEVEGGLIRWCLDQPWLDDDHPYLRRGLERVLEEREQAYQDKREDEAQSDLWTEPREEDGDDDEDGDDLPF